MRLMRLTTAYPAYLDQLYRQQPELSAADFATQYERIREDSYGWSDFWNRALVPLDYEVFEPLANAVCQQRAWAEEHGVEASGTESWKSITLAQAEQFQPDIVFSNDHRSFDLMFLQQLREQCRSVRLAIAWCGAPYTSLQDFAGYDLLLSNIPSFVWRFQTAGLHAAHMAHAFAPVVLERIDRSAQQEFEFTFIGSVVRHQGFHRRREQLLRSLSQTSGLQLAISVSGTGDRSLTWQACYDWVRHRLGGSSLPGDQRGRAAIGVHAEPPLFGTSMYQRLFQSRVTFNNHIDVAAKWASNMRLFEATGVGTCLLTERQPNLSNYFEPEQEVVTYGNASEAAERYQWLRDHPVERQRIAEAGQRRTLRDHTFVQRALELDALIRDQLARSRRRSA